MNSRLSTSEAELLQLAAKGNEAAFRELFHQYWPQVYGTCLHLTHSPELAKDLAQDIFVKLWCQREGFGAIKKLDAYIYTVSRNLVLDHLRKKVFANENIDLLIDYFSSDAVSATDKLQYKELEAALQRAVNKLPGKVQEVFRLSRFEGLSHPEIARKLNISVVSSRTYIVRALQEIREYLATHQENLVILMFLLLHSMKD